MFNHKIRTQLTNLNLNRLYLTPFTSSCKSLDNFSQFLCYVRYSSAISLREFREDGFTRTASASSPANGLFHYADHLFDDMPRRRYQQYADSGSCDLFRISQDVIADANIFGAKSFHALALKQGTLTNLLTVTSLITVYSKNRELGSALDLFSEILDRDVVFWNAMMSACMENKFIEGTVSLFTQMIREGNEFDFTTLLIVTSAFSYMKTLNQGQVIHGLSLKSGMLIEKKLSNALINMYAKCGDLSSADCIFRVIELRDLDSWNSMINGYLYNGNPEKSLYYFKLMASYENQADDIGISSAMAACTLLQAFDFGIAIHGWSIKLGYAEKGSISVDNSLISFYSQLRELYSVRRVFESIGHKNVVSWNSMIKGFFLNDDPTLAFSLLHDMQFVASLQPDLATVLITLPFCAEFSLVKEGKAVHGFVVRMQMADILSVCNSLINMYSKCCFVKQAEYLFGTTPKKDLIAWNTMVFGYAQSGMFLEAKLLFKQMLDSNSSFSLPTLLAITPSCDSPDSYQFGKSIHGWSIKLGFSHHLFGLNSLIYMYLMCGFPSDAFKLFNTISVFADVTSWNTIICGCAQGGYSMEALESFKSMRKSQTHCDCVNIVSVISACGDLGYGTTGKVIQSLCFKTGTIIDIRVQNSLVTMYGRVGDTENARLAFNLCEDHHNLCSWNCVLSALSQNEDAKKALELFSLLEFSPNEMTFSTILSACTQLGSITFGKQIHGQVFRLRFHRNPYISSALIDMYSNSGRLDIAERVFISTPDNSVSEWNSLISAYGFHNYGEKAIETFEEMTVSGIRPTNASFTCLITSCSHTGLVDQGLFYYDLMLSKYKLHPSAEHYVSVVHMLGRCGRLQDAYDFIEKMEEEPDTGVWGALLSCCSSHGDVEMGRKVAELLFRLEPENASYYVTLCNMYVGAGRWEEAVEIRNIIQDKQLRKPVGFSTIDIN